MLFLVRFWWSGALLAATACGGAQSEPGFPSSSYSGPSSYGAAPTPTGVVANASSRTGLKARPDVLTVPFALRLEGGDPALLDLARNRVAQLQARFKTASGGTGEVRVTGLAKEYAGESKLREPKPWTRLDGCLEIPLADSQDYWARAKLLLAIKGAIDELRSADTETEPRVTIVFDEPQAGIKDVERYREQLTLAWVARMRKFMAAAQSEAAPLEIVDCAPPTDIIEARVSIEEVVLDLKPTCKLDVLARGSERQR